MDKRAMWWIVLGLLLIVAPAVAADEPAADPGGLPAPSCVAATSAESHQIFIESLELDPLKDALPAASNCCSLFGCCTHIQSGCEPCSQGRRWYSVYSCPGGGTCTVRPTNCPTPC